MSQMNQVGFNSVSKAVLCTIYRHSRMRGGTAVTNLAVFVPYQEKWRENGMGIAFV